MAVYRLELSKSGRAVCKNAECKKNGVKILAGELRFCNLVTIKENQSWQYKHWGCVTPKQLANIKETIEDDLDLLDGYEDLDTESQEKVRKALADGHVEDSDWKGDIEQNRPGKNGFRTRTPKKKGKPETEASEDDDDALSPSKPEGKKRGRAEVESDGHDDIANAKGRPVKKARKISGKKAKAEEHEAVNSPEPEVQKAKNGGGTVAKVKGQAVKKQLNGKEESIDSDLVPRLPQKKTRGQQKSKKSTETKAKDSDTGIGGGVNRGALNVPKGRTKATAPSKIKGGGEGEDIDSESEQEVLKARKSSRRVAAATAAKKKAPKSSSVA